MPLLCDRFVKCWNRQENSCSRCDFEYLPVSNLKRPHQRENEMGKSPESKSKFSVSGSCKPYGEKQMDIKKEEKVKIAAHSCVLCSIVLTC